MSDSTIPDTQRLLDLGRALRERATDDEALDYLRTALDEQIFGVFHKRFGRVPGFAELHVVMATLFGDITHAIQPELRGDYLGSLIATAEDYLAWLDRKAAEETRH